MKMPFILTQIFVVSLMQFAVCHLQAQGIFFPPSFSPQSPQMPVEDSVPPPQPGALPVRQPAQIDVKEQPLPQSQQLKDRVSQIIDYWFGPLSGPAHFPFEKREIWLADNPEAIRQLNENFSLDVLKARKGEYNHWRETAKGRLALVILLDQIPRHIYRDKPQAFSSDPMARGIVLEGIQKGEDKELYPIERAFFYLPLEHSEDLGLQNMSVAAYQGLLAEAPLELKPEMQDFLDYAIAHYKQIARFGRFPARNAILGRQSTPEERLFLQQSGRSNF